ncbi:MAG: hypothetical protein COT18_03785 [Elusimicrobia bacterium CG08_land_8_20_14_0_20_59_10]|nr:MAG: hypothetical protein COT18_03785 [Elusimicrobia bacterium CG08_land_8_20_14_0_20_59_10]
MPGIHIQDTKVEIMKIKLTTVVAASFIFILHQAALAAPTAPQASDETNIAGDQLEGQKSALTLKGNPPKKPGVKPGVKPQPKPPVHNPKPPVVNPKPPVHNPKPPVHNPKPPVHNPKPPVNHPKPPVFNHPTQPTTPGNHGNGTQLPRPRPPQNYSYSHNHAPVQQIHQNNHHVVMPRPHYGHNNQPFNLRPSAHAPHSTVINLTINNVSIINQIHGIQSNYWSPYSYHWYSNSGVNFCHYYDSSYHWYGFNSGGSIFWTRYYNNRFWWYDPYWHRWVYYYGGSWWWQSPSNATVIYIYVNNSYYNYGTGSGGMVLQPVNEPAPYVPPADYEPVTDPAPVADADPNEVLYYSDDGTRMAQVYGDRRTAALYDLTEEDTDGGAKYLNHLGVGVTEVRFKNDQEGKVANILVLWETAEGGKEFTLLDANGCQPGQAPTGPEQPVDDTGVVILPQLNSMDGVDTRNLGKLFDGSR